MTDRHFQSIADVEGIKDAAKRHGFGNLEYVEKFMNDYEILYHVQNRISDCTLKGGMAVPFYVRDERSRRLSIDVDVMTAWSQSETAAAMRDVAKEVSGWLAIRLHVPRVTPSRKLPLLTYMCEYESVMGGMGTVKIDMFYGIERMHSTTRIEPTQEIMGLPIDFPVNAYSRESLIGDKLTTLPRHTIGLDERHAADVPKQIYDVASLLNANPQKNTSSESIVEAFVKSSREQMDYIAGQESDMSDILEDLAVFSDEILGANMSSLEKTYEGRLGTFKTHMLKRGYRDVDHITDVLLVRFLSMLVRERQQEVLSREEASDALDTLLGDIHVMTRLEIKERNKMVKQLVKQDNASPIGMRMKGMTAEQKLVYGRTVQLESGTP